MAFNLIGEWRSVYAVNMKEDSTVRYPVGYEKSYTKATLELLPDGRAVIAERAIMKLFKNKFDQRWIGDDSGFAVLLGSSVVMTCKYTEELYPFEALIAYDDMAQMITVYKRESR